MTFGFVEDTPAAFSEDDARQVAFLRSVTVQNAAIGICGSLIGADHAIGPDRVARVTHQTIEHRLFNACGLTQEHLDVRQFAGAHASLDRKNEDLFGAFKAVRAAGRSDEGVKRHDLGDTFVRRASLFLVDVLRCGDDCIAAALRRRGFCHPVLSRGALRRRGGHCHLVHADDHRLNVEVIRGVSHKKYLQFRIIARIR